VITATIITSLFNSELFLDQYLKSLVEMGLSDDIEVLLLFNQPNEREKEILNSYRLNKNIKIHVIDEREGLYATWNRGIRLAQGKYIGIWNVDDIRTKDGLYEQIKLLDEHSNVYLAYGDFNIINSESTNNSELNHALDFNNYTKPFRTGYHIGCFQMWKKDVHEKIGYYDEQFKIAGDFDFQTRVAQHFKMAKIKANLGLYLNNSKHKLSSQKQKQIIENNIVYLRNYCFSKINLCYLHFAKYNYDISNLTFYKVKYPLNKISFQETIKNSYKFLLPLIRFPKDLIRYYFYKFVIISKN
jgi:hypothetical protein